MTGPTDPWRQEIGPTRLETRNLRFPPQTRKSITEITLEQTADDGIAAAVQSRPPLGCR